MPGRSVLRESRLSPVGANPIRPIGRSAGSNQVGPKSKESHLPVRIVGRSVIPPYSGTCGSPFDLSGDRQRIKWKSEIRWAEGRPLPPSERLSYAGGFPGAVG